MKNFSLFYLKNKLGNFKDCIHCARRFLCERLRWRPRGFAVCEYGKIIVVNL